MKQIKMSDDGHRRLLLYADGRPLGKAIERLLDMVPPDVDEPPGTHQADTGPPPDVQITNLARGTIIDPPLDAQGIPPDSKQGKATWAPAEYDGAFTSGGEPVAPPPKPLCTCTPAERGKKGAHNKHCPARGA